MKNKLLSAICFAGSALCLAYFGVIAGYSGISTSLCWIWPVFALVLACMGLFMQRALRHRDRLPEFFPTFVYTSFFIGLAMVAGLMDSVIITGIHHESGDMDYCIVMGARVYSDGVSRTLLYRLDKALEVYRACPDVTFVLTGGQDRGDAIPEAFAMYNYLSMKGVPSARMLLEPKSTTTHGLIRNAAAAIRADADWRRIPEGPGEQYWSEDYEPKVGIITSDYHMFRTVSIAGENGIRDPLSVPAASDSILFVHNCVRESAAILKDFFMGNFNVDESFIPEVPLKRIKGDTGARGHGLPV